MNKRKIHFALTMFFSETKNSRDLERYKEILSQMWNLEGFNEEDHKNIKEIATQTPRTMNSVAGTYVLHKKNRDDTLKSIQYSLDCGYG